MAVPERVVWAVATLDVQPDDRLLEIGCGRGSAVREVCQRLVTGRIVAIDRSAAMVRLARERNAEHVAAGRAVLHATPLDRADLPAGGFDKAFAINVNLFWVRSAINDLEVVRRSLRPDGRLYLFYEPPIPSRAPAVAERVSRFLTEQGFAAEVVTGATRRGSTLLAILARPPRPAGEPAVSRPGR